MKKKTLFILPIIFTLNALFAQEQAPPDKHRKAIETKHARIIFSKELGINAQKAAFLIDSLYQTQSKSLDAYPEKVPVLLYNKTVISNGYAALYPRRSAWYTTGMQDPTELGNADWLTTLGIHEFRHIVQYEKYNQHFTKFLSFLFGETGIVMGRWSVPFWFSEGDAITAETAYTIGGRGRIPKFEMPVKTLLAADIKYKYPKAKLGSYKNYYPSHYHLGWLLVSYARLKYGADVWAQTLDHTSKISFWPYAFSRGLKKHTGLNERALYDEAMQYYDSLQTENLKNRNFSELRILSPETNVYTTVKEAEYTDAGEIIFLKSDLKKIKHFYKTDKNGETEKLFPTVAQMFSAEADKICFTKTFFDKRYNYQTYSDIMLFDLKTKKLKRLTKEQKYFAPALSPDGKKIALAEHNDSMQSRLVIIDTDSGKLLKKFPNPKNDFLRTPVWSPEGNQIAFTAGNEKGLSLILIDYESGKTDTIINQSKEVIGRPAFYKNFLLYNSNYDGIGNIYAADTESEKKYRVTSVPYGIYNPKIQGDSMLADYYTKDGYKTAFVKLDDNKWEHKEKIKKYSSKRVETLTEQENHVKLIEYDGLSKNTYPTKAYKPMRDAVKIYGWGFYSDYESQISFNIYSNNLLNTVRSSAGISYNVNEEAFGSSLNVEFAKYYPIFKVYGSYNQRYLNYETQKVEDYWDEWQSGLSVTLPIRLKAGVWNSSLEVETDIGLLSVRDKELRYLSQFGNGEFIKADYSLFWYRQQRRAHRDIYPRFGSLVHTQFRHLPFSGYNAGQFSFISKQYLPGLFANHSFSLAYAYESQPGPGENYANYYLFQSPVRFARGYDPPAFTNLHKFSSEYHLPVWYPDFGLSPVIYFKRLRAGVFFDYVDAVSFEGSQNIYPSIGSELYLQFNLLNLEQSIEIGGRASYLFDNEIPVFELIMASLPF